MAANLVDWEGEDESTNARSLARAQMVIGRRGFFLAGLAFLRFFMKRASWLLARSLVGKPMLEAMERIAVRAADMTPWVLP
jgi:hypothetical protein